METRSYAIFYHGSKTPNLIGASSLGEAEAMAGPLSELLFPGRPLDGLKVTRFRGNPRRPRLPRDYVLSLLGRELR